MTFISSGLCAAFGAGGELSYELRKRKSKRLSWFNVGTGKQFLVKTEGEHIGSLWTTVGDEEGDKQIDSLWTVPEDEEDLNFKMF